jgi:hypothetical protein
MEQLSDEDKRKIYNEYQTKYKQTKQYDTKTYAKKYYDKNKNDPDFMYKMRDNARTYYYKKKDELIEQLNQKSLL